MGTSIQGLIDRTKHGRGILSKSMEKDIGMRRYHFCHLFLYFFFLHFNGAGWVRMFTERSWVAKIENSTSYVKVVFGYISNRLIHKKSFLTSKVRLCWYERVSWSQIHHLSMSASYSIPLVHHKRCPSRYSLYDWIMKQSVCKYIKFRISVQTRNFASFCMHRLPANANLHDDL